VDDWADKSADWVRNERIYDRVFAPFTAGLLEAADLHPGHRVLDVGCGAGTMLAEAARAGVAASDLTGVDLDPRMVAAARRRVPGATVVGADAATVSPGDLPAAPFDRMISRFGVMFFPDPVGAFRALRATVRPDARLAFVSWRRDEEDMFSLGMRAAAHRAEELSGRPVGGPRPNRPGALGLADADHVTDILRRAGWRDIAVAPTDATVSYGETLREAVDGRLAVACAGNLGRAARAVLEPAGEWDAALATARTEIRDRFSDGRPLTARVWTVTANSPSGHR
jgi:SAM-dependent methyltransferase